jgi:hypothetical protein
MKNPAAVTLGRLGGRVKSPAKAAAARRNGRKGGRPRRYGPWQCKQRPAGDWVVDQLDRETMRVRRYGPYPTEAEARTVYADLELEDATMKCWLRKRIKRLPLSPE